MVYRLKVPLRQWTCRILRQTGQSGEGTETSESAVVSLRRSIGRLTGASPAVIREGSAMFPHTPTDAEAGSMCDAGWIASFRSLVNPWPARGQVVDTPSSHRQPGPVRTMLRATFGACDLRGSDDLSCSRTPCRTHYHRRWTAWLPGSEWNQHPGRALTPQARLWRSS